MGKKQQMLEMKNKMTIILNRAKRTKKVPMTKNTHSITDIEGLINEKLYVMQNGSTMAEKKKARTEVIRLEKMLRDIDYKEISGKGYEKRVPPKTTKTELLALIDSIPDSNWVDGEFPKSLIEKELDTSGVSPGKNRFEYVDKGW